MARVENLNSGIYQNAAPGRRMYIGSAIEEQTSSRGVRASGTTSVAVRQAKGRCIPSAHIYPAGITICSFVPGTQCVPRLPCSWCVPQCFLCPLIVRIERRFENIFSCLVVVTYHRQSRQYSPALYWTLPGVPGVVG